MRSKRRKEHEQDEVELVSRELAWLEVISSYTTEISFGAPMRCPAPDCGDFGLVESIADGRQHNRCWSCGTTWTMSRHALRLVALAAEAPEPTTVIGAGTLVADLEPADAARTSRERFVGVRVLSSPDPAPGGGPLPSFPT